MRHLLFVPIVHAEADLGSLGPELGRQALARCGEERWAQHLGVVSRFWQRVADYLFSLDPVALRLYQDGLAAEGELALRIIEEAARRGSPNHRLLLELVRRGAIARKTEDEALLLGEWQSLFSALGPGKPGGGEARAYRVQRNRLLRARDRFIAGAINGSLKAGETGVLFLGAYHDPRPYLARDIAVREVKELDRVRGYFQALFPGHPDWPSLADYLASPIPPGEGHPLNP